MTESTDDSIRLEPRPQRKVVIIGACPGLGAEFIEKMRETMQGKGTVVTIDSIPDDYHRPALQARLSDQEFYEVLTGTKASPKIPPKRSDRVPHLQRADKRHYQPRRR